MSTPRPIWMDCDPGVDDLFAILLCLHSESLNLIGLSSSTGNSSALNTGHNCLKILHKVNRLDIPVIQGSTHPMTSEKTLFAEEFHGANGLDIDWPLPVNSQQLLISYNFPEQIYSRVKACHMKTGQKVTLLVTGPCTNIALLLKIFPDVTSYIQEVVIMGGALQKGNVTPHAEYNIWSDPEAADVLLRHKDLSLTMVGLEATHQVCLNQSFLDNFIHNPSDFKHDLHTLLLNFGKAYKDFEGFLFPPCHDYLTLFFVMQRRLFDGEHARYRIDCREDRKGKVMVTQDTLYNQILVIDKVKEETKQIFLDKMWTVIDSFDSLITSELVNHQ